MCTQCLSSARVSDGEPSNFTRKIVPLKRFIFKANILPELSCIPSILEPSKEITLLQILVLTKASMTGFHWRKYKEIITDSRAPTSQKCMEHCGWVVAASWCLGEAAGTKAKKKKSTEERWEEPVIYRQLPSARAAEKVTSGSLNGQV